MSDLYDRFFSKVDFENAEDPSACWNFKGGDCGKGYGQFWIGPGKGDMRRAHIVAYELTRGPVAFGFVLDHTCNNKRCCRPSHLEAVTVAENTQRFYDRRAVDEPPQIEMCRRVDVVVDLGAGRPSDRFFEVS